MPRFLRIILGLFVAAAILTGGVSYWAYDNFFAPGPLASNKTIVIPKGAGVNRIADILKIEGVIDQTWLLVLGARLTEAHRSLQAGEYDFPAAVSPSAALQLLVSGKTVRRFLTVPEGLTSYQVRALLLDNDALSGTLVTDIPEGRLFPATYDFSLGDNRQSLADRMRAKSAATLDRLWQERPQDFPLSSKHDVLVLASIIEKESGVASERPRIASVFFNRLRRGMRLQSDPTVVYAVTQGQGPLGRSISRADLNVDNPYNTYKVKGLPPGPICNPGQAAIEAVMKPAHTKDLYFVADGTGGHAFARTLREHNRNVAKWRKLQKSKK